MRRRPRQRRSTGSARPPIRGRSAWVSANAGSGKTTVLTRRVIRLLLDGVAPSAILCLTFTKAAAANMQNRIFERPRAMGGAWRRRSSRRRSRRFRGVAAGRGRRSARARRLFAAAVETPGGLKVLTIHAFCERVLHLFPFEANVPAQFAVLDDRSAGRAARCGPAGHPPRGQRAAGRRLGRAFGAHRGGCRAKVRSTSSSASSRDGATTCAPILKAMATPAPSSSGCASSSCSTRRERRGDRAQRSTRAAFRRRNGRPSRAALAGVRQDDDDGARPRLSQPRSP